MWVRMTDRRMRPGKSAPKCALRRARGRTARGRASHECRRSGEYGVGCVTHHVTHQGELKIAPHPGSLSLQDGPANHGLAQPGTARQPERDHDSARNAAGKRTKIAASMVCLGGGPAPSNEIQMGCRAGTIVSIARVAAGMGLPLPREAVAQTPGDLAGALSKGDPSVGFRKRLCATPSRKRESARWTGAHWLLPGRGG